MLRKLKVELPFLHANQDSSLVLQFLLSEFFRIMHEVYYLEELLKRYQKESSDSFRELLQPLTRICGGVPSRFFPWGFDEGDLNKLNTYLHLFSLLQGSNKHLIELQSTLDKGLKEALNGLHLLKASEKEKTSFYVKEPIEKHLESALRALKKLPKVISSLLYSFKKDENLFYFLLRSQHYIRDIYGKRFLQNYFEKAHPGGRAALERYIVKGYSKRGFKQLAPSINEKIAELFAS